MRIIHTPAEASSSLSTEPPMPRENLERVEALEKIVKSILDEFHQFKDELKSLETANPDFDRILETLKNVENRLTALEAHAQASPATSPERLQPAVVLPPESSLPAAPIDPEVFKTDLRVRMWKYLNDERRQS